jgi:hypothetical protein
MAWRRGKLTSEFFDYLNFTIPCGEECPLEYGIFHSCKMAENREEIVMEFSVPEANLNLTRLEADPFLLMKRNESHTCEMKYSGPTVATVSLAEDCVYETHDVRARNFLELATLSKCKNSSSFKDFDNYFQEGKCKISIPGDEREFVQVKLFGSEYHIYCSGSSYKIGKREMKCPVSVFALPISLTFTLNDVEYKGNVMKVIYRDPGDPFLKEHLDYHLSPNVNWSSLADEIQEDWDQGQKKILSKVKDLKVFEFRGKEWTIVGVIVSTILIGLGVAGIIGLVIFCKRKWDRKVKSAPKEKDPEEIPLDSTVTNHHIIVREEC